MAFTNLELCDKGTSLKFELLSYNVKWPPSDARGDQVLLKAYSQATTLETHTCAHTQPVRWCQPELVEALSDTPHKHAIIAWL